MAVIYGALDLNKNELRQAVVQNLAVGSPPSAPLKGQLWFDSTNNILKWYDGGTWVAAMGGAGATPADTVSTQGIGDVAAPGSSTLFSRGDHKHAMPSFGSSTAETSYGTGKSDGVAATIARSDHTHGNPSITSNNPSTQAIGDAAALGSGILPARDDHKHAMPAFGAVTGENLAFGSASQNGTASTVARSDHAHGNPGHAFADHSAYRLDQWAVPTASVNLNSQKIINLLDPTAAQDGATKNYVDNALSGLSWKDGARVATTANITLSGTQTIDGVAVVVNDRVLVKNQTTPAQNGLYSVQSSAWTRTTDADANAELEAMAVYINEGTTQADTAWVCSTNAPIAVGGTALTFVQFGGGNTYTAGNGLTLTGNVIDFAAGDSSLTVAADSVIVNTAQIATVASVNLKADKTTGITTAAGSGLTGGGDLSTSRALSVDYSTAVSGSGTVNVARKFTQALGGTASPEVITHGLNTQNIQVTVLNGASPYTAVEVDWDATSTTTCTIRYSPNLGAGYRIVVVG